MRGRAWLAALTLSASMSVLPAPALASPTATQIYVRADYELVRSVAGKLETSHGALASLLAQVRRECPLAASGSPEDSESTQLSNEVIGAMVLTGGRPDLQAIRAFVRSVNGLRWGSRALTRTLQAYARELQTLSALGAPALCADVSAWAAAGFRALPSSAIEFEKVFMANWVSAGDLPAQLSAYEDSETRSLARHAELLEARIAEFEAREVTTWDGIMNALVLLP